MSAEANVTPLEEHLSPPPTGGSDTTGLVLLDSGSDVYADVQSKPLLAKDVTPVHLLEETPPLRAISVPAPISESECSAVEAGNRGMATSFGDHKAGAGISIERNFPCPEVVSPRHVELRQNSALHYNAGMEIAYMLFEEVEVIGETVGDRLQARKWRKLLSFSGCEAFLLPEGDVANEESKSNYTYMQPDGCITHIDRNRECQRDIYDQVLPTVVMMAGIDVKDEEMNKDAHRWLSTRVGLTTEVNALINVSVKTESNTCISVQLSVYGRPTHFKTDQPLAHLTASYNLYSKVQWKQELRIKPIVPSISLPSSVLWRAGCSPKGYPVDERITLPAADLELFSINLLKSYREAVANREEWHTLL